MVEDFFGASQCDIVGKFWDVAAKRGLCFGVADYLACCSPILATHLRDSLPRCGQNHAHFCKIFI